MAACEKLAKLHNEHIAYYDPHKGKDNEKRLTGRLFSASFFAVRYTDLADYKGSCMDGLLYLMTDCKFCRMYVMPTSAKSVRKRKTVSERL